MNHYARLIHRMDKASIPRSSKSSSNKRVKEPQISEFFESNGESESEGVFDSPGRRYDGIKVDRNQMYRVHKAPKRGSDSTQSSSLSSYGSGHSNYVSFPSALKELFLEISFPSECQLTALEREEFGELQPTSRNER